MGVEVRQSRGTGFVHETYSVITDAWRDASEQIDVHTHTHSYLISYIHI